MKFLANSKTFLPRQEYARSFDNNIRFVNEYVMFYILKKMKLYTVSFLFWRVEGGCIPIMNGKSEIKRAV